MNGEITIYLAGIAAFLFVFGIASWILHGPILPKTERRKTIILGLWAVGLLIFAILFVIYLVQTS